MLVKTFGAAVQGIDATPVTIEVNSSRGIRFFLVGLPDSAVRESHERIVSALQVNGYPFPACQLVVNMAPADIRKEGSAYDLPLAAGILAATGGIRSDRLPHLMLTGELGLDGSLQPVRGALPIALAARRQGLEGLILPRRNACEAAVVEGIDHFDSAPIQACDLRAGAAMVIVALAAHGTTEVSCVNYIERGYEDIVGKLRALGANIRVEEVSDDTGSVIRVG